MASKATRPAPCRHAAAADVGDHAPALDQRGPGRAKESLWHVEALHRVFRPDARAFREVHRVQLPLSAKRVNDAVGNDRHRPRAFVEAEVVAIVRGVCVAPPGRSGCRVERLEHLFVADAMKEQQSILDDDGSGECLPDLLPPDDLRSRCAPCLGQRRSGVGPVALRSKELWPVGGDDRRGDRERNQDDGGRERGMPMTLPQCGRGCLVGSRRLPTCEDTFRRGGPSGPPERE